MRMVVVTLESSRRTPDMQRAIFLWCHWVLRVWAYRVTESMEREILTDSIKAVIWI
jgi:hypothetical protein